MRAWAPIKFRARAPFTFPVQPMKKNVVFLAYLLVYGLGMYWLGMRSAQKEPSAAAAAAPARAR